MKPRVILVVLLAGLKRSSAEDYSIYQPVDVPLPYHSAWPEVARSSLSSFRIVGGREARPHSHPHQVALLVKLMDEDEGQIVKGGFCGGSIISSAWVITAAHCVDKRIILRDMEGTTIDKYRIKVTVLCGAHNFTNENEAGTQRVNVSEANVTVNPKWDIFQLANDIALLRLNHKVKLDGKQSKAIRLPKMSQKTESFADQDVTMTGWGVTASANKRPSEVLNTLDSKVVGPFYCKFYHLFLLVKDTNICASGWGWRGACYGDSGGPMIIQEADNERTLIGITSFGIGCSWNFPSVYTRVSSYLDWIHSTTGIPPRN